MWVYGLELVLDGRGVDGLKVLFEDVSARCFCSGRVGFRRVWR